MSDALLVLNAGSSSLKFAAYAQDSGQDSGQESGRNPGLDRLLRGHVSGLGSAPRLRVIAGRGAEESRTLPPGPMSLEAAAREAFAALDAHGLTGRIAAVGHRIVHGGRDFTGPVLLDQAAMDRLRRLVPLAPLHQPYNLDIVDMAARRLPNAAQIGCFDTGFHARRPELDRLYALPRDLAEDGVIAYGFHGLSYQHIAGALRERDGPRAGGRAIVLHLGGGASACAMESGRSVATTMGFSALEGLMMSTRCGSLDPGVALHLIEERGMSPEAVADLLYRKSGLLGVSGLSGDMQALLDSKDARAAQAVDLFVYRAGRAIGSLAAALGGLDTLVFTAGIGENSPDIRRRICAAAQWLGAALDEDRNARGATEIGAANSRIAILTIPTDEERAVAEGIVQCLAQEKGSAAQA